MNLLAIDTSTEYASVALTVEGKIYAKEQGAMRSHARLILPIIEQLLADASMSMGQLDAIVYGQGPGSFTGLRIACSVAKGLAYAHDLPLYPVSSLAAIADEVLHQHEHLANSKVLAVIDARMNQLYWACFNQKGEEPVEQVFHAADLVVESTEAPLILAGVGYETYLPQFTAALKARISQSFTIYPKAEAMLRLVLRGEIKTVSAMNALPRYIRNQITQGEPRG